MNVFLIVRVCQVAALVYYFFLLWQKNSQLLFFSLHSGETLQHAFSKHGNQQAQIKMLIAENVLISLAFVRLLFTSCIYLFASGVC